MKFSDIRDYAQSNRARPLLIRTSRTAGYYAVQEISAVQHSGTRLHPDTEAVTENWLLLGLVPHASSGASTVVPLPSWELPDLTSVMTAGEFVDAVDAAYNDYAVAVALSGWVGRCGDSYRQAMMMEKPSGKYALVYFFEL